MRTQAFSGPSTSNPSVLGPNIYRQAAQTLHTPASSSATGIAKRHPSQTTDQLLFSGTPKAKRDWKKYIGPTLEVAAGSTIAATGLPLHLLPGAGNAIALVLHIVGGLIALHGAYRAYQRYQGNDTGSQTPPASPNQPARSKKPATSTASGARGGNTLAANLAGNAMAGAAAGATAGAAQEMVGRLFHSDSHKPEADQHHKAKEEHHQPSDDGHSDAGDDHSVGSVSDASDFGDDFGDMD